MGRATFFLLLMGFIVGPLYAEDSAKTGEDVFKSKGLIKTGFMLVLPQEQALHEAVGALRAAKGKVAAQAARIKDADAQIKAAEAALKAAEDEIRQTDRRLANDQNDVPTINRHNFLVDDIKEKTAKIKTLTEAKDKLMVSRSDYITAVLDASAKADAAAHAYDGPHADKDLAAVIEKYNLTAKPKVKLGPSAYFTEDLAFVNQCKADVTSGTIPITTESGVPNVEGLINGKLDQKMIWDSGCTGITLSAKTAKALGLKPLDDDRIEEATIADGSHVKVHVKVLDSIRIGAFTVQHVLCAIPSAKAEGADLLGNEFQHLFQFKLDINSQTLQLSPLDTQRVTTVAWANSAMKPVAPGPDAQASAEFGRQAGGGADDQRGYRQICRGRHRTSSAERRREVFLQSRFPTPIFA
jgi:hypothetical protein